MEEETINKIYSYLDNIELTSENEEIVNEIREQLDEQNYKEALQLMKKLSSSSTKKEKEQESEEIEEIKSSEKNKKVKEIKINYNPTKFPKELSDVELECKYIGLLLLNPEYIIKFYFIYEECYFENDEILNIYKSVLFTEGSKYTPEIAKRNFNFDKDSEEVFRLKYDLKSKVEDSNLNMEKIYTDLKKLFVLRKSYLETPIKELQSKVVDIRNYILYDKMSAEEVKNAIIQVNDTEKFKRAIISTDLSEFLKMGDNNLTNGLPLIFPILSSVFKGIRKGETMAFAMPSNSGKSRFTINLAAHTALVHKKKVLIISNEMAEDKVRLCLITTIINNKEIQKIHGIELFKTEGELLEFKFRPDKNVKDVELDENGFIIKRENETQKDFVNRLSKISTEFNKTIQITDWANKQINNSIYFINITDHTNDELKKVIMNYYYKEKIEYVFYDTLKTDTANIGIGEELKKTATILSNLAQNFSIYICSTLQLAETSTLPVNLTVNDLAVSRTVKEVLDTLCLIKQINRDNLKNYEYSLKEVDTKFFNLEEYKNPDVRYYACVVDKNRAGAKPTLLFRLNLAYNVWEELGYLRLKQENK